MITIIATYILNGIRAENNISNEEIINEIYNIIDTIKTLDKNELIHRIIKEKNDFTEQYGICKECGCNLDYNHICINC